MRVSLTKTKEAINIKVDNKILDIDKNWINIINLFYSLYWNDKIIIMHTKTL